MFHSITGVIEKKTTEYAVVSCSGIGFKVFMPAAALKRLSGKGESVTLFTHFHMKDDGADLFGFLTEPSLSLFELLISVAGVGPRTALAVLSVDTVERITAAILEKRVDLLLKAPGIGKKTAERIILELESKLELAHAKRIAEHMTEEGEIEEALFSLGYSKSDAREAVAEAAKAGGGFEEKLRGALRILGSRNNKGLSSLK